MNSREFWRLPVLLSCLALAGCMTVPSEGDYVTFVRDVMGESARLKEKTGNSSKRSEAAERAVRVWRGAEEGSAPE